MSKIIDVAQKYIGTKECPINSNKTIFGKWANYDGVAWCGLFVSKCYEEASFPLPKIGFAFNGFAGCQTAVNYFTKTKEVTKTPIMGDIVFFDWNGDLRYDHVGLFEKDIDGVHFQSIEGNTSVGNDSNGGEVMRRFRAYKGCVFVHPKVVDKA